jgi:inosose dehydratase
VNALMQGSTPDVKLLFDTGHLLFGGADVMRVLNTWADRVHHVHFKDIRPDVVKDVRANRRSFLDAVIAGAFTVPGDGCIDFQAVTDKLKAMDYAGWIVVEAEQDPAKAPPYEYSKLGYEHILKVCKSAGLLIDHSRPS